MDPILVLQIPDPLRKRTVAIAATRNPVVLRAFKDAVLADAQLACVQWESDSLLRQHGEFELRRLEELFSQMIPDDNEGA